MDATPDVLLLVVNGHAPTRYLLAHYLRGGSFRVIEAADAAGALELAARERPDVVVLDVNLPDLSGYEVARRLRTERATGGVGIVFVSASYTAQALRAEAGEGDAYLAEPVDPVELLTTVALVLRTRRS
jgi:CheY-like chemotaxis protein